MGLLPDTAVLREGLLGFIALREGRPFDLTDEVAVRHPCACNFWRRRLEDDNIVIYEVVCAAVLYGDAERCFNLGGSLAKKGNTKQGVGLVPQVVVESLLQRTALTVNGSEEPALIENIVADRLIAFGTDPLALVVHEDIAKALVTGGLQVYAVPKTLVESGRKFWAWQHKPRAQADAWRRFLDHVGPRGDLCDSDGDVDEDGPAASADIPENVAQSVYSCKRNLQEVYLERSAAGGTAEELGRLRTCIYKLDRVEGAVQLASHKTGPHRNSRHILGALKDAVLLSHNLNRADSMADILSRSADMVWRGL